MRKIIFIFLTLIFLSSCGSSSSILNLSEKNGEKVIIDNFFEKTEKNIYKSILSSRIASGVGMDEKELYFKKENSVWLWSFDKTNWSSVFNKSVDCIENCDTNGVYPIGNNLKIINHLKNYSERNNTNNDYKKYNYLTGNYGYFAIKSLGEGKYELMCYGIRCNDEENLKNILEKDGIDFSNVEIERIGPFMDVHYQNMLNAASNKAKMQEFISYLKETTLLFNDFNDQFTELRTYPINNNLNEKYSTEISEILSINNEYVIIDFEINEDVFISNETTKKSSFDFIDDWIICDDKVVSVSGYAYMSCTVIEKKEFENSIKILDKYFYAKTEDDGSKKYYYNNSFNYLSFSDIEDNKVKIELFIESSSFDSDFIKEKIDFGNERYEIKSIFIENMEKDSEEFEFDNKYLKRVEENLVNENNLKFDGYKKNIKIYDSEQETINTLLYKNGENDEGQVIKINDLGNNITINGEEYEAYIIYSSKNNQLKFNKIINYGNILFNKKTKKVYILDN